MNPFLNYEYSFKGAGVSILGVLVVLLFIAVILKKSDAELKVLRARSKERHKFVPPEPAFPNQTSVAGNMINSQEINYTPFIGNPNYGSQGETIFQQAKGAAPTPFDKKAEYTEPPINGYIFDLAGEPSQYTGIPKSEPYNYPNQAKSLFETDNLPLQRYETDSEGSQDKIYSDFGKPKITDVITSSDAALPIEQDEEQESTAPVITGNAGNKQ